MWPFKTKPKRKQTIITLMKSESDEIAILMDDLDDIVRMGGRGNAAHCRLWGRIAEMYPVTEHGHWSIAHRSCPLQIKEIE